MSEATLKGACVKCGEHIAFPESHANNKVPCPHCRAMTPLIPGKQADGSLFYKCFCNVCWDKIEYHARLIGSEVPCPHCKQNTVLAAPGSQSRPMTAPAAAAPAAVAPASSIAQKTPVEPMAAVQAAASAARPPVPSGPPKPVVPGAKPVTPAAKPVMPGATKPAAAAPAAPNPAKSAILVDPVPGPMANPPPPPPIPRAKAAPADTGRKPRPKWLIPVAVSVGVLILLGVAAVFILPKLRDKGGGGGTAELEILDFRFQPQADTGLIFLVGTVTNRAAAQAFNVKLQFELFDQGNNKLGVAQDSANVIEPKGAWRFKASVPFKNAEDARPLPLTKD